MILLYEPIRNQSFDLSGLDKFGEQVFVFDSHNRPPSIWSEEWLHAVEQRLNELQFDHKRDYLALLGRQVPLCRLVGLLSSQEAINALAWNAVHREYMKITL